MLKKLLFFSLLAMIIFMANVFLVSESQAATTVGANISTDGTLIVGSSITPTSTLQVVGGNVHFQPTSGAEGLYYNATDNTVSLGSVSNDYSSFYINVGNSGSYYDALSVYYTLQPTGAYPMYSGIGSVIYIPDGESANAHVVESLSGKVFHSGSGKISNLSAVDGEVYVQGTGNVADLMAFYGTINLYSSEGVDTGDVTNAYLFYGYLSSYNDADITNNYGIYFEQPWAEAPSTITNNYGIYLANQMSGTTQNYAIYTDGGDWVLDADGGGTAGGTTGGGDIIIGEGQDLEFYHDGTNSYIMNNTGDLYVSDAGTDDVILSHNGGRVGIATTTPGGYFGEKLTVVGNTYTRGTATTTGDFIIGDGNTTATTTVEIGDIDTAGCIKIRDADADAWTYCYTDGGTLVCTATNVCGK